MNYNQYTLPNGLRIIHESSVSKVTYAGFAVDAGPRDESSSEQGMAHLVEHLIFKGTTHRRAWHILNRMENVGGDLNAYTNKEETVLYASFLTEDLDRAVELMSDMVFHSTFPDHELDKEKEVILDEIQSYEDNPSELIFDDFEDMIFKDHSLGRNILGNPQSLNQITREDIIRFWSNYYQPSNMVFFVLGNVDFKKVIRLAEKYTGHLTLSDRISERIMPPLYVPQHKLIHKETHQAHVMVGNRGYDAHNNKRTGLYLLNNMLGGPGMNSRLNVSLRERKGLVYSVESNLTSYTDTGIFCIYFGTDPNDVDRCLTLTYKELKKLCDLKLTPSQLAAAKKQLIGQIGVASDNNENNALGMAKTFLHYNRYEASEAVYKRIESITSSELLEIANELFGEEQLSTLIYK